MELAHRARLLDCHGSAVLGGQKPRRHKSWSHGRRLLKRCWLTKRLRWRYVSNLQSVRVPEKQEP